MPWLRLRVAEDAEKAGAVADLLRAFIAAHEAEGRPQTTALFAKTDQAGVWTFYAMGTKPPAVAEVVARFGFKPSPSPKPEGMRLLVGHPVAARVIVPHVKRSRAWWAETRKKTKDAAAPAGSDVPAPKPRKPRGGG